jgi:hypothetical protein
MKKALLVWGRLSKRAYAAKRERLNAMEKCRIGRNIGLLVLCFMGFSGLYAQTAEGERAKINAIMNLIEENSGVIRAVSIDFIYDPLVYGIGGVVDIWWGAAADYVHIPWHTEFGYFTYGNDKQHDAITLDMLNFVWLRSFKERDTSTSQYKDGHDYDDIGWHFGFGLPITAVYKVERKNSDGYTGEEKTVWAITPHAVFGIYLGFGDVYQVFNDSGSKEQWVHADWLGLEIEVRPGFLIAFDGKIALSMPLVIGVSGKI